MDNNNTVSIVIRQDVVPWLVMFLHIELENRNRDIASSSGRWMSSCPENAAIETRGLACVSHLLHQLMLACAKAEFNPFHPELNSGDAVDCVAD